MSVETSLVSPEREESSADSDVLDVQETTCCIVGGGPGGAVLALLLARQGIPVMLLEAHEDFDRDFRGDTLHPSVLEIMDALGLADRLHKLRHTKISQFAFNTPEGSFPIGDFRRLKTKFPYIMMLPQEHFLEFITDEAKRHENFQLLMGASAQELIVEDDVVRGVRYRSDRGTHEVRALLTIGADGRSSRVRRLAGFEPQKTSPPMDIIWFRLPRKPTDPEGAFGRVSTGHILIRLDRMDEWQIGYVIPKGGWQRVRKAGLPALREAITDVLPEFPERVEHLQDWEQVAVLSVESSRCPRWYRPGLLLIGDAAHVMSPVGGVGINYAIQDAVAAANILSAPLKAGKVETDDLRKVQREREFPTKFIQSLQAVIQRRLIAEALDTSKPFKFPLLMRLLLRIPILRNIPARLIAFGIRPARLKV
ncbi:MAG TPA: FAD-dependent oxidoreductase [Pyrinomonadaceae bacterium]|jgi:2-polyprenyl-6-methoxyphenol hydroxylase-like FAD-dependent oxidoreductase